MPRPRERAVGVSPEALSLFVELESMEQHSPDLSRARMNWRACWASPPSGGHAITSTTAARSRVIRPVTWHAKTGIGAGRCGMRWWPRSTGGGNGDIGFVPVVQTRFLHA
jgi:hypothetical protein